MHLPDAPVEAPAVQQEAKRIRSAGHHHSSISVALVSECPASLAEKLGQQRRSAACDWLESGRLHRRLLERASRGAVSGYIRDAGSCGVRYVAEKLACHWRSRAEGLGGAESPTHSAKTWVTRGRYTGAHGKRPLWYWYN
jgi:hypothetical protein